MDKREFMQRYLLAIVQSGRHYDREFVINEANKAFTSIEYANRPPMPAAPTTSQPPPQMLSVTDVHRH